MAQEYGCVIGRMGDRRRDSARQKRLDDAEGEVAVTFWQAEQLL